MADLSSLGAGSEGVWTRCEALRLLTPGRVDTLVREGAWQAVWRGVYADGGSPLTAEQRAVAAVLATGSGPRRRAVAAGRTAARVWRSPLVDDDDPATGGRDHLQDDVACRGHLPALRHRGRLLHRRETAFAPGDVVRTRSGLLLTSPLRTLVDCAVLVSAPALVCALDDALHRGVVRREALERAVRDRAGLVGAPALRTALAVCDGRSESPGETLLRLVLLPVLPSLVPQVRVRDGSGRVVRRYDLGDERVRLGLELDGRRGHAGVAMVAKDRSRDRAAAGLGWHTERFTWGETRCRPDEVRRRALAEHARLLALAGRRAG